MFCPYCGKESLEVINSRSTKMGSQIWRRRKCLNCMGILTTYEKMDLSFIRVIKKGGIKKIYNRAKLYSGIYSAAVLSKKSDRGDMAVLAEKVTQEVETALIKNKVKEISTDNLISLTSQKLKKHPHVLLSYLSYFLYSQENNNLTSITTKLLKLASKT